MIYHVFANKSNIGDWLSALGIQSVLSGYELTELFCDEPFIDDAMGVLRKAGPGDLVIVGGGGLFMDYFSPFWESFLQIANGLPYGIWGTGYCDLIQELSLPPRGLIEEAIRGSRFCYVRDELTRGHHREMNLPTAIGCPSLMILDKPTYKGRGLLHVDNYTTAGEKAFEMMDKLGRDFAEATARPYRRTNNRIRSGDQVELQECLELYRQSDIVLSSALHGCIVGLAYGCKVVAVSGDRKIDSFMESVGLSDWVLAADDLEHLEHLLQTHNAQNWPGDRVKELQEENHRVGAETRDLLVTLRKWSHP